MRIYALSIMLLLAICAGAQQPKFETASVRHAECSISNSIDPVSLKGDPLNPVLVEAFHVRADQIEGPAWLDT